MGLGLTPELAFIAACVWIVSFLLIYRTVGAPLAIILATIKVGITLVYFSYLYTGDLLMRDDRVYHEFSVDMFDRGWGPIRMITEPEGMKQVAVIVGSDHFLYYWWNLLAFTLFGKYYYSPVFMNVGLTFASAAVLGHLVRLAGFAKSYTRAFITFFLLHWDLITWSSFVNLKDMIVLFLTISAMYSMAQLGKKISLRYFLYLAAIFGLFSMLRYYLPVLLMAGGGLWMALELKDKRIFLLFPVAIVALLFIFPDVGSDLEYVKQFSPFKILRFFLIPQFWTLQPDESFLFISSLCHWLMFIPLIFGAVSLWKHSSIMRLPLLYAGIILVFYSMVPELQGYRHRMQLTFIIAWCQFQALCMLFQAGAKRQAALQESVLRR